MSLTCDKCNSDCDCISGPTVDNKWVCDSCNITPEKTSEGDDENKCKMCGEVTDDVSVHPFGSIALCDDCICHKDGMPHCPRGVEGGCYICDDLWYQYDTLCEREQAKDEQYESEEESEEEKAGGL